MRIYEELFIVRPDVTDEEIDPFIEQMQAIITSAGGTIDKTEKWGIRKLAYRVAKRDEGYYVLLQVTSDPDAVKEMERRMRVSDLVMKSITVRIDERLKKIEKRRKEREKRAKRRPAPMAASPARPAAAPAPAVPAAPAAPGEPVAVEPTTTEKEG